MSCFQAEEFTKEDRMLLFETENFKEAFKQMDRNEDDKVVSRKYSPDCLQVFLTFCMKWLRDTEILCKSSKSVS